MLNLLLEPMPMPRTLPAGHYGEDAKVIHNIGKTAGEIWQTLHKEGEVTVAKLKRSLRVEEDIFYMALGWLAREDQIVLTTKGRSTRVSLKRPD